MKQTLKYIVLAMALLYTGNLVAQEENSKKLYERYNWFVSGALNGEWLFKTTGNMYLGGKIGGGIHLDRFSAIRLNFLAGKNRIDSQEAEQYGVGLDYMVTLVGNNGFRPFNLAAIIGANFNFLNTDQLGIKYKDISAIGGTFAIQASYNINRKLSFFIEPSLSILPKYYSDKNKDNMYLQTNLALGISYSFKDKYKVQQSQRKANANAISSEDAEEIKNKINLMLKEIEILKEEYQTKQKVKQEKNLIIEPKQKETVSIDVYFDEFSSFISQEQAGKIESIGEWMKENPASIKIVAFSNDLKDKDAEESLRSKRTEAIKSLLINRYHIVPERITSATPESMGYENKTGSNAMIIYIPDHQ